MRLAKPVKGRAELLALANELGGPAVMKEVAFAADDPQRYLATTNHELFEDFDDDDVDDDLPWLALIEALHAKRRLAEVDWKVITIMRSLTPRSRPEAVRPPPGTP